jgi:hypothetical protein
LVRPPIDKIERTLTRAVREYVSNHCCSHIAARTGKQRLEPRYEPAAVASERPEEACPSYIRFNLRDIDGRQIVNLVEANLEHSHTTTPDDYEMACCRPSTDQIAVIHEMTRTEAAAEVIRACLGVAIQPDTFHYEMRKTRKNIPSAV